MVLRHRPRGRLARPPRGARRRARRRNRPARPAARSTGPSTRSTGSPTRIAPSTGCRRSRRSCSSPPASGREVPGRGPGCADGRVRRDPGRPGGRSRPPTLLADATPAQRVLARAVMNGETTDPDGWRVTFPTLFSDDVRPAGRRPRPVRGDPRLLARRSPIAATRSATSSAARSSRPSPSGCWPGAPPAGTVRRERRILFDGVRAEIHPYDVTVERDGRGRGVRLQVGRARHQRRRPEPARRRADACGRRGRAAWRWRWSSSMPRVSCDVRLDRQTAPTDGIGVISLETLDELATGPMTRRPARLHRRVPGPVRRGRARTASSGRRRSCAMPRTSPAFHSAERGFDRALVRASAAWPGWPGPRPWPSSRRSPTGRR